jgi:hypothetical protein
MKRYPALPIAIGLGIGLASASGCTPPPEDASSPSDQTITAVSPEQLTLWRSLGAYLAENGDPNDAFMDTFIDLNQDGTEDALVLMGPPNWCGTGGCTLLVFEGTEDDFQLRSSTTLVQSPFIVSENETQGWRDLVLEVYGGGATPATVALQFDGQGYPLNPSTLEPLPANSAIAGDEVFSGMVDFRSLGDTAGLEAACQEAITTELGELPESLEFARTDEGGSAYVYTLASGATGTCRVTYDGIVEYI